MTIKRALFSLLAAIGLSAPAAAQEARRPNFLIIIADDLGFSDIGAFGGEIATPNLDALAYRGLRLTGFHVAPTCSPTRSMLLSGTDNHLAGLGTMAELVAPNQKGKSGHEGYLRRDVATLAEILANSGYRTLFSGKWHLGLASEQDPHARGFQSSFALLQGGHNHFGLGASDRNGPTTYTRNGEVVTALPKDFYSSDYFAAQIIDAIGPQKTGQPFFAYLAFTAPHWPLQAPSEDIARYRGRYDAGYEALRKQRLKRQIALGLLDPKTPVHALDKRTPRWSSLSKAERAAAARDMEIYAAMVDRMDRNIGLVIEHLRRIGELDNTVILFMADNGAEGIDFARSELPSVKQRLASADNSFASRGTAASYIAYGPGWAQAATAPSWLYKAYTTEGGTRATAVLHYPGIARQGSIASAYLNVMDVVPTFLDLAGVQHPSSAGAKPNLQPVRGRSWSQWLRSRADRVWPADKAIGTELFGSRAVRRGDWKLVDTGDGKWRLFNIAADPGETRDLAGRQPDVREALVAEWDVYARDVGVMLPDQATYRP